jgi:hypothetical protein
LSMISWWWRRQNIKNESRIINTRLEFF